MSVRNFSRGEKELKLHHSRSASNVLKGCCIFFLHFLMFLLAYFLSIQNMSFFLNCNISSVLTLKSRTILSVYCTIFFFTKTIIPIKYGFISVVVFPLVPNPHITYITKYSLPKIVMKFQMHRCLWGTICLVYWLLYSIQWFNSAYNGGRAL